MGSRDDGAEFLRGLGRVGRQARRAIVLRRLVPAALAGLVSGLAYLAVRPFLPPPFTLGHPLAVPGLLAAAALIAGAVAGFAVRIGRSALAVQADRSLGTRGLASAALELAEGRRSSTFAGALLEDAAAALRDDGPRRVIARPRLRLLPWTLAAAVLVLGAGLSPWTLRDLFPARKPPDRIIAILGGELEESGRKLEEAARGQDLRQGLELSRELQQLGKDLAMQDVPAEELSQRLSEMEGRVGGEYELMLQRFREQPRAAGTGPGDGSGTEGGDVAPMPGSGEDDPGGGNLEEIDPAALPPGAREMAEALDLLRDLQQRSASRGSGGQEGADDGGGTADRRPGDAAGTGDGSGEPGPTGSDEGAGAEGDPSAGSTAGTSPVTDERGPATDIARGEPGELLDTGAPVGEGEMARMLMRALPESTGAAIGEERVPAEYRRQAESALAAEEVPLALRDYVRHYFTGTGVLGN
jgi:hypothetical protein